MVSYSIVIPTLNAEKMICNLIDVLNSQTIKPNHIFIVDSSSSDNTVSVIQFLKDKNIILKEIEKKDFDHGKTRDLAIRELDDDFIVLMTQDALPIHHNCMEELLKPFCDEKVAAVSGRQIAYDYANKDEKLVRYYNYLPTSRKWNETDISKYGIGAFCISDVCCAYRKSAYLEVGGFDYPIETNEDMLMAEKLLHSGYTLVYNAEATVYHSHDYSFNKQFKRNYIVGRTLEKYKHRFDDVSEVSKGSSLFKNVCNDLIKEKNYSSLLHFIFDCIARFSGNRIGRLLWKINQK